MLKIYTYGEFLNNNPFVDVPESLGDVYFDKTSMHDLILSAWTNRHTRYYSNVYNSAGQCIGKFEYDVDYGKARINGLKFIYLDGDYWEILSDQHNRPSARKLKANGETYLTDNRSD